MISRSKFFQLWMGFAPLVLAALLFQSFFLALLAPLPILILAMKRGLLAGISAVITNCAILYVIGGEGQLQGAILLLGPLFLLVPTLCLQGRKLNTVAGTSLLLAAAAWIVAFWLHKHGQPVEFFVRFDSDLKLLGERLGSEVFESQDLKSDEFRAWVWSHLPGVIGAASVVALWLNLSVLLRLNLHGIRHRMGLSQHFFREWKSPEWLVWPVILCLALLLKDFGRVSVTASNFVQFFLAVYFIQGMAILLGFLEHWKVSGFMRWVVWGVLVFMGLLPLVSALGFFDLWFDFRKRIRQT